MSRLRNLLPVAPLALGVILALTSANRRADADPASDAKEKAEKCATRLYTSMIGLILRSRSPRGRRENGSVISHGSPGKMKDRTGDSA